jgi:hypothetical protein
MISSVSMLWRYVPVVEWASEDHAAAGVGDV